MFFATSQFSHGHFAYFIVAHKQKFDIMAMEKWPIIQAFALEEVGGSVWIDF